MLKHDATKSNILLRYIPKNLTSIVMSYALPIYIDRDEIIIPSNEESPVANTLIKVSEWGAETDESTREF